MPVYNWTGFYIGANGGGGFGYSKWDTTNSFNPTGGVAGGTLGYNYQIGAAVLGVAARQAGRAARTGYRRGGAWEAEVRRGLSVK